MVTFTVRSGVPSNDPSPHRKSGTCFSHRNIEVEIVHRFTKHQTRTINWISASDAGGLLANAEPMSALTNCRCFARFVPVRRRCIWRGEEGVNHGTEGEYGGNANTHQRASMTVPTRRPISISSLPLPERHVVLLFLSFLYLLCVNACAHWRADRSSNVYTAANFPGFCDTDRGFHIRYPSDQTHHFAAHLRCHLA